MCNYPRGKDLTDFLTQKGYYAIPIQQNNAGHLLVATKLNGVEGLFILDTGAGGTVVDSKQAGRLELSLQKDNKALSGAGAGGQGLEVIQSSGNRIEIGNHIVEDFTLSVMSLEHVIQALAQAGSHEEFLGVVGVDILKPGNAIIDYRTMTLYLSSEK